MSTGGPFQLISNTGIQDRLLMSTQSLLKNVRKIGLRKIAELRKLYPNKTDREISLMDEAWMPTLRSIEKSHILFINSSFKPFVAMAREYSRTPCAQGNPLLGTKATFTLPIIGEFVNDMVVHIKLKGLSAVSPLDKVRYVEFLGHRLAKKVTFSVQGQVIDTYTTDDQNAYFQFRVPLHKEIGYLRNIGQEIPHNGYLTADPAHDEVREYRRFGDGSQTFKNKQIDVDLWIPILFWFKDVENSLPNFLLPMGQTEIELELEKEENIISYADYGGGGKYNVPTIDECSLYINHIFLLPEIHKIFITRFGFQLVRVHKQFTKTLKQGDGNVRLHTLKWPIECMFVCFRPQVNLLNSSKWHRCAHIVNKTIQEPIVVTDLGIQINNAVYYTEQHVIKNMALRAHDIEIYPSLAPEFYNNYIPSQYGEHIKTPRDIGWYMINFAQKPGEQQPSGHFNVSRSRELYLFYQTALDNALSQPIIRVDNPVDLIVTTICINFVLYHNHNMVLKFTT